HTNFKISSNGETIKLYNPSNIQISSLNVNCGPGYDVSAGSFPDATGTIQKFSEPTPGASNNTSIPAVNYTMAPVLSVNSGIYTSAFSVNILDPNNPGVNIYYTLDASDPDTNSILWNGIPISVSQTTIVRARSFLNGYIPSTITSASYLFNLNHTTPIISVISDSLNLFGPTGMFTNVNLDILKPSSIEYFDSTASHNLLFSRKAGIIMDGGVSTRSQPQPPFRIKLGDGVLGDGPISYPIIPDVQQRTQFSDFYMRNGGFQFNILPYKDAAQVKMMAKGTSVDYSAWRPVSVYVNGAYWGLYELREKFNTEKFQLQDGCDPDSIDLLSVSGFNGWNLLAIEGSVKPYYDAVDSISALNVNDTLFWEKSSQYFDLENYNDYLIGETWMGNTDWIANNMKIYRSNATNFRWRFCIMDLEVGLNPNGWTNCYSDQISWLFSQDLNNVFLRLWHRGMQNNRFRDYFINRFADQMNSIYLPSRLLGIENDIYSQVVAEMGNQYQRWGDPNNISGQLNDFYQNHLTFQSELSCRSGQVRNHIQSNFNLPQQVQVELDVFPSNGGKINISTISPDIYPWNGIYFDGVPIQIEALAMPGYQFSHWESNGQITDTLDAVFLDTLTTAVISFKAHFISTVGIDELKPSVFHIYPNPTSENLTIKQKENIGKINQLSIYDVLGKEYHLDKKQNSTTEYWINVSSLGPGFYLIKCQTDDGKLY
ncbi:MAG: CotH kinase family protein, partial [Crocinitomicaceae bacterium]